MTKLRTLWEQIRNVPGLGGNLLAVTLMLVAGLVAAAYLLPKYEVRLPWQGQYTFSAVVEKAPGMKSDSKHRVLIAGIQVGTVQKVEATPDGRAAIITMGIDPVHKVYQDARIEVRTLSPLNDVDVALASGDPSSGELPEDATLPQSQSSRFIQINEVLDKLDTRSQQAVTSLVSQADIALKDAPRDLPGGLSAGSQALDKLRPVVQSLQTRRATIEKLVTNLSYLSTTAGKNDQRLASLLDSTHEVLGVLARRDTELSKTLEQLPDLRSDLDRAVNGASDLTTELNPALDAAQAASKELPGAVDRLTTTVEQAGPVVRKLKPVVDKARPVISDLRPLVPDLRSALDDLKPVTKLLPDATCRLVPWLPNLQAFVYHTSSAFSVADANGGLGRAQFTFDLTNPTGGLKPTPNFTTSDRNKECR